MNIPEQHQIDHWIKMALDGISETEEDFKNGFYIQKNIPIQSVHTGTALFYATLARAKFLNGDPIESVREQFANACKCIIKSFTMAYDQKDPDYIGDKWPPKNPHYTGHKNSSVKVQWLPPGYGQVSWAEVCETYAIAGMNYALMAGNFDLAWKMSSWFQDRPDGKKMDPCVNRYTHALALVLQNRADKAGPFLEDQLNDYKKKTPKSIGDKNYYSLITTIKGIIDHNENNFNYGLIEQIKIYQSYAQGEAKDTDEEFICDDAVALANLGIKSGLKVTAEHYTLPMGLLTNQ